MLTLTKEKQSTCFKFIGANTAPQTTHLISNNTSLISNNTSLISPSNNSGCDTCSFYSGASDATIMAFGESTESCGSIAFGNFESSFSGAGASVSVASSGGFSGCSVGGGCSYSC